MHNAKIASEFSGMGRLRGAVYEEFDGNRGLHMGNHP